jgi:type I restriction enzyme S subunit
LYPNDEKLLPIYFYMALKNIDLKSEAYTRHFKFLKEKYIIRPCDSTLEKYNELCKSMFDEILSLQKQNQNLKETRDMLIPKLVSGEVEV